MEIDMSDWVSDQDYDAFRKGYVEAMLWANTYTYHDGELESEDVLYQYQGPGRWWTDTPVDLTDADNFLRQNLATLHSVGDMSQHGHDFALTRNHHGAGFWDRGYGDVGDALTEAAHAFGTADVYLDNDEDED